jgi:molecular chaperone GrpE
MRRKRTEKHSRGNHPRHSDEPGGPGAEHTHDDFEAESGAEDQAGVATDLDQQPDGGADQDEPQPRSQREAGATGGEGPGLGAVTAELESYRDRLLRLAAEYDNFRKRTERERAEDRTRAQSQIIERVLDAIDDLQRVAHVDPEKTSATSVLEGVQLVERKLMRILEGAGLEPIDATGQPFDPEEHEALAAAPTEDRDQDDVVADVFQKGYRFKGTLVRPARVRVYKHEG